MDKYKGHNNAWYLKEGDPMPFGQYQGKKMVDVPADYLLFLYDNNKCNDRVKHYIEVNLETLRMQAKNDKKGIK